MKKIIGLLAIAAMMVGMLAGPVSATATDVGTFTGTAGVGKSGTCDQDGNGTVSGAGLGLPGVHENGKTGWWVLQTNISGVIHGAGSLKACGKLGPVAGAVGAACGVSRGHSGKGTISFGGVEHVHLLNLGWISSAGGALPVIGNTAAPGTKIKTGTLTAVVYALGGVPCTTKSGSGGDKTGGAVLFDVVGTFDAVDGVSAPKAN